jgi:hypothetical protein
MHSIKSQLSVVRPLIPTITAAFLLFAAIPTSAVTIQLLNSTAPAGGSGSFDVVCIGDTGLTADFSSFDMQIDAPPDITFTTANINTAAPYIFGSVQSPPFVKSLTAISLEVADSDVPVSQLVSGGQTFGFVHVDYSVASGTPAGPLPIGIQNSSFVLSGGDDFSYTLDPNGQITVTVPEPIGLSILPLATLGLLARKRRPT